MSNHAIIRALERNIPDEHIERALGTVPLTLPDGSKIYWDSLYRVACVVNPESSVVVTVVRASWNNVKVMLWPEQKKECVPRMGG